MQIYLHIFFFFLMSSIIRTDPCQLLLAKVRSAVSSKELIFIEKAKEGVKTKDHFSGSILKNTCILVFFHYFLEYHIRQNPCTVFGLF